MKITAIVPWLVKVESSYWGEYLFVEVRTDDGLSGWGEITTTKIANHAIAGMLRQLNELLVGDDPTRIERLWHKTFRAFTYMGSRGAASHLVSGVDIALWDILGKSRGLPIYEMLGGPVRDDILIYTHPDQSRCTTREGVVEEIRTILDSGHDAIKFDPFPSYEGLSGSPHGYLDGELSKKGEREAAELTALIRETAPRSKSSSTRMAASMCRPRSGSAARSRTPGRSTGSRSRCRSRAIALGQVRKRVSAAISVGERLHTRWEFVPIFENSLADYVMPDVTWTGGITELKKIAALAEAYYIPVSPHDASGPINVVAGAHVMMTVPNFYRIETNRYDLSSYNRLIEEPLDNRGGRIRLNGKPGLGVAMNLDYLRRNAIDGFDDHRA
jgi:galactonate dehydratase